MTLTAIPFDLPIYTRTIGFAIIGEDNRRKGCNMSSMNISSLAREVEAHVRARLTQYVQELLELCAIDSGTHHKLGLDEMATVLAARLRGVGMDVTIFKQEHWGNDLLGIIKGEGGGNVTLLGHIDTVYPVGTAAARPVWVEGNTVYGPGVIDMKGCILLAIYAIEALLALGYGSFGEIRFLCVSDEEIPERHCIDLIHQVLQDCQAALVLEAACANGDIVSARKATGWYKLHARGRAAHAGTEPEKGRNAIMELAHQMFQFQSLNGWREGVTISPGVFSGGTAFNMVPDYAEVFFDLRYLHPQDRIATEERWRKMMQQHLVSDVELTLEAAPNFKEPMVPTPESLKLVRLAQEVAVALGFPLDHALTGGAGDAGYASQVGIPVVDGLGPIGGLDHSPNEYLRLDSIAPRAALLAALIASVGARTVY